MVAGARVISKFPSFISLAINSLCSLGDQPGLNVGGPGLLSTQSLFVAWASSQHGACESKHRKQTRSKWHGSFLPALEVT